MREMAGKKEVVIVGSFKGVNTKAFLESTVSKIHKQEMKALDLSLKLANAMGVKVRDVVYGMGDSSPIKKGDIFVHNRFADQMKTQLEQWMNQVLSSNRYNTREELSWGADELMLCAFAQQLPNCTLSVTLQDPSSRSFYDNNETAKNLIEQAAKKNNLTLVKNVGQARINLVAFTLLPEANKSGAQTFPKGPNYKLQHRSDHAFASDLQKLDPSVLSKTVVVDAHLPGGAMDTNSLPPDTNGLGWSSWGTGGNNFGQSLAMAKILADAQDRARQSGDEKQVRTVDMARRQLVVEAIAHDAFFTGFQKGASGSQYGLKNPIADWITKNNVPTSPSENLSEEQLVGLHRYASSYATAELKNKYPGLTGQIQFIPTPFNRRLESYSIYTDGVIAEPGSISGDLVRQYREFFPRYRGYRRDVKPGTALVGANGKFFDS